MVEAEDLVRQCNKGEGKTVLPKIYLTHAVKYYSDKPQYEISHELTALGLFTHCAMK